MLNSRNLTGDQQLLQPTERKKYWEHLSYLYMTEESDDPDDSTGIIEHKLTWRSDSKMHHVIM